MASALSTNEVTVLYNDVLFRSASAAEVSFWATQIDAGTSIAQMTNTFVTSAEALTVVDPIIRLYNDLFSRAPDAAGLTFWVAQAHNGMNANAMAQAFVSSAEFAADYGSNIIAPNLTAETAFINSLYTHFLGRGSDASGLAYWQGILGTPTIASEAVVVSAFANSAETIGDAQAGINTFLTTGANSAEAGTTASTVGTPTYPTTIVTTPPPPPPLLPLYTLSDVIVSGRSTATEGDAVVFNLATTNVAAGTQLAYTLAGVTAAEVVGGTQALAGTVTVGANGTASISVTLTATTGQGLSGNLSATLSVPAGSAIASVLTASAPLSETASSPPPPPSNDSFTLTTGVDNLVGLHNTTFSGTYSDGGIGGGNTFQIGDTLTGPSGANSNTLAITPNIAISGGAAATSLVDAIWANISHVQNVSVTTTAGAINITTGTTFNTAFASGVSLTANSTGGAITIDASGTTAADTFTAVTTGSGAQTITTGSGASTVTATAAAGAQTILGANLTSVTATNSGAGAQTITSTGAGAVTIHANGFSGVQTISTGIGADTIILNSSASAATINGGIGNDTITLGPTHSGIDTIQFGPAVSQVVPTPWLAANTISPTGVDTITSFRGAQDVLAFSTASLGNGSAVGVAATNIGVYANTSVALNAVNADIAGTAGLAALAGHQSIILVGSNTSGSTLDVYIENAGGTLTNTVAQEIAAHEIVLVGHVSIIGVLAAGDFASIA